MTQNIEEQLKDYNVDRISGKNRYETAIKVSKGYTSSKTVVLASGEKYTDELTATVLANKLNAPLLLTMKDNIPTNVLEEIQRLGATNIIIIGGNGTISKLAEKQLSKYTVDRIGGTDRYETAVLIGNKVRTLTGNSKTAILVDGTNFPDAIAMTSMAVEEGIPILLTNPNNLTSITNEAISKWKVNKIVIGGGSASVSNSIETSLRKIVDVERIAGSNRYETSVLVAKKVYSNPNHIVIASGETFPDAIVGAPYATKNGYPIVLSQGNNVPEVLLNYTNGK